MISSFFVLFLFISLSRFGISKSVKTETLRSSVIFKTIMVTLPRGRFVVVHIHSSFSMDFQNFPSGENLYQNLPFFCDLKVVSPHFLNHNGEIWRKGVDLGHPPRLPRPNLVKVA